MFSVLSVVMLFRQAFPLLGELVLCILDRDAMSERAHRWTC